MTCEPAEEGRAGPQVAVQDGLVARASAQDGGVPGYRANPVGVSVHHSHPLHFIDVPDLHFSAVGAQREQRPLLGPGDRGGRVRDAQVAQLGDLGVLGVPEVDAGGEPDGQVILGGPVDEVEVVVVLQGGCIQHFAWQLVDLPSLLAANRYFFGQLEAGVLVLSGVVERGRALLRVPEDVAVLEGLHEALPAPAAAGHHEPPVYVGYRAAGPLASDVFVADALLLSLVEQRVPFEQLPARDVSVSDRPVLPVLDVRQALGLQKGPKGVLRI